MSETLDVQRVRSILKAQGITQSELVIRSGLSCAQVSRILTRSRSTVQVRETTLQSLANGLRVQTAALTLGGPLQQFRKWMAAKYGAVDFRGIGMPLPLYPAQPLSEVFVEPDVITVEGLPEDECRLGRQTGLRDGRRANPPVAAATAIRTHDRVSLLGHPGSGKTTVLHWLAHVHASGGDDRADLPLYVRLPEFTRAQEIDPSIDLIKFVAAMARANGCPDLEDALRDELRDDRRRTLVLLDGLDEVGDEKRMTRLIESVRAFIEQFPRNRFVITSRIVGFDPLPWTNLALLDCGFWTSVKTPAGFCRKVGEDPGHGPQPICGRSSAPN